MWSGSGEGLGGCSGPESQLLPGLGLSQVGGNEWGPKNRSGKYWTHLHGRLKPSPPTPFPLAKALETAADSWAGMWTLGGKMSSFLSTHPLLLIEDSLPVLPPPRLGPKDLPTYRLQGAASGLAARL